MPFLHFLYKHVFWVCSLFLVVKANGQQQVPELSGIAGFSTSKKDLYGMAIRAKDPPPKPVISDIEQPSCENPYGSFRIVSPSGPQYTYSLDGSVFWDNPVWRELGPGTYSLVVKDIQTGSISEALKVIIESAPEPISHLYAFQTYTPGCITPEGIVNIEYPSGDEFEYSMDDMPFQSSPAFREVYPGTHYFVARNKNSGCTSPVFQVDVVGIPGFLLPPDVQINKQPDCKEPTGMITVNESYPQRFEYTVDGLTWQADPVFSKLLPGSYRVRYRVKGGGCLSGQRTVVINTVPLPPLPPEVLQPEVFYCRHDTNVLPLDAIGANLKWYAQPMGGTGQASAPVPATGTEGETTWYVSQTDEKYCESERSSVKVTIWPLPLISIQNAKVALRFGKGVFLPVHFSPASISVKWTPEVGLNNPALHQPFAAPVQSTQYFVKAASDKGCLARDSIYVEVIKELFIPNAFTPNNDGLNDAWNIPHLGLFGRSWVRVYNRTGKLVFESTSGNPAWDGTWKGGALPSGTYFYVVDAGTDGVFKGNVTLIR